MFEPQLCKITFKVKCEFGPCTLPLAELYLPSYAFVGKSLLCSERQNTGGVKLPNAIGFKSRFLLVWMFTTF